ncbi:hypothetical protein [Kitasatospora sp. CB02891]|uniref:hypothetical protein n=1 Tax=Kitasatospora sp. CB02891 TaxID=2020329 RepID=UPI000C270B55|nr:hypothetical protein [Kitasatospora sp. CB02891]PJN23293.1 hypothetical protein CG736_23975 [Kitasatospora sp. CB02891]
MTDRPADSDRPLDQCLDAFWQGGFTLRPADAPAERPDPALDHLGPSGLTVRGRDLAELLAPDYRRLVDGG